MSDFAALFSIPLVTKVTGLQGQAAVGLIQRIREAFPDEASRDRWLRNARDAETRGLIERFAVEMEIESAG